MFILQWLKFYDVAIAYIKYSQVNKDALEKVWKKLINPDEIMGGI